MAGLRSVYLHNNKLTEAGLPEGMFNGSDNLEVLIMSSNFLRYVPRGLPSALYRLHLKVNTLKHPRLTYRTRAPSVPNVLKALNVYL